MNEKKDKENDSSRKSVENIRKDKENIDESKIHEKFNKEEKNKNKSIEKNIKVHDSNNKLNNEIKKREKKTKEQQVQVKVKEEHKKRFNNEVFAECQQVIGITNDSKRSRSAKVSTYEKENGQWKIVCQNMYSTIGKNGMEYSSRRKQNTYTTPAGIFNIEYMFGWGGNPGVKYQYKVPDDNSYWNLNNGTPTYNRWVEGNPGGDNEHLKTQRLYKQAIVLDYNMEQIPNKGGAIFIHLNPNQYTGGCIGLNESDLVSVMKWLNPSKNPKVLICPSEDFSKYYN